MSSRRVMTIAEIEKMIEQRVAAALAASGMQGENTNTIQVSNVEKAVEKPTQVRVHEVKKEWDEVQEVNFHQYPNKVLRKAENRDEGPSKKKEYTETQPYCEVCEVHHPEICEVICGKCKTMGHKAKNCVVPLAATKVTTPAKYPGELTLYKEYEGHQTDIGPIDYTRNQTLRLETEFWKLEVKGTDLEAYTSRFKELAVLCPHMVTPEFMRIERYIWGLPSQIQIYMRDARKETIEDVILLAKKLMNQMDKQEALTKQLEMEIIDDQGRNFHFHQGQEAGRSSTGGPSKSKGYFGKKPWCNKCEKHHAKGCTVVCLQCKKKGHMARNCRVGTSTTPVSANKQIPLGNCFECGELGHFKDQCPRRG